MLRRFRSARTGQYVTKAEAAANKDTTVSETSARTDELTDEDWRAYLDSLTPEQRAARLANP